MKLNSILFPTDFSHYNDAALEYASTLAAEANAKLFIVHVHDTSDLNSALGEAGFVYEAPWLEEDRMTRDRLEKVAPTMTSVKYERHYLTGPPVAEILDFAAENRIDLIVMASHGRSGISRLIMGSVAEGVMRKATCPVLIVKQPVGEREPLGAVASEESPTSEMRI
jgi:nucleotide-binding universal stress UspA family protein